MALRDKHIIIVGSAPGRAALARELADTYSLRYVGESQYVEQRRLALAIAYNVTEPSTVMVLNHNTPKERLAALMTRPTSLVVVAVTKTVGPKTLPVVFMEHQASLGRLTPGVNYLRASYDDFAEAPEVAVLRQRLSACFQQEATVQP